MKRIEIDDFTGPLDLLLTLVQQEELSLIRIQIVDILDQLIQGLENDQDLNESGDAIIIISTLLELKSKILLPGEVDIAEEIESLKEDLLTKILVHRRLSQVLDALEFRMDRRSAMIERPPLFLEKETVLVPMEMQNPFALFSSISFLLEAVRQDTYRVDYVILPVDFYFEWIQKDFKNIPFHMHELAKFRKDSLDFSGVLIALLELVRQDVLEFEIKGKEIHFKWLPEVPKDDAEVELETVNSEG